MWAWALLGGPALSGALAEPIKQYPHSVLVHSFQHVLEPFPFVLPNLVSVLFCSIAIMAVYEFVPETLPAHKCRSPSYIPSDFCSWLKNRCTLGKKTSSNESELEPCLSISNETPSVYGSGATTHNETNTKEEDCIKSAQLHHTESGLFLSTSLPRHSAFLRETGPPPHSPDKTATILRDDNNNNDDETKDVATISSLWSQLDTRNYLIVYWIFSFYAVAVDEAFPLFCISQEAGLGLSEGTIGKVLSGAGFIFALCQYFCYAAIVDRFGLQVSIQIGIIVSSIMVFLIPGSLWLNRVGGGGRMAVDGAANKKQDTLKWSAFVYLSFVLAMYRTFTSAFFASTVVATNRTVIPSHRATMNGFSMMGGSVAKGLGPTFAGLLVSFSVSSGIFSPNVGAVLIFVVIGLTGLATAVMTYCLLRPNDKTTR
jgi:hypothetical protein